MPPSRPPIGLASVAWVPLESLHPDPQNARSHDAVNLQAIQDSLAAFGQQKPLVVDHTGLIVAGNGTWAAAQALGWSEIAVTVTTLDPLAARAYSLADNRSAELAAWNDELLATALRDLQDAGAVLAGWTDTDIDALLRSLEAPLRDPPPQLDQAETLRAQYGVETGQIWGLGAHRLWCGDATDAATVHALLGDVVPLLMVTDPPYGVDYNPQWRQDAAAQGHIAYAVRRVGKVVADDQADWRAAWKLFPGHVIYCWHAGRFASQVQDSLLAAGFEVRTQVVWAKPHFAISRGHYHWQHEPCWYAVRKGAAAHWIGDRSQSTLWQVTLDTNVAGGHSTQKPLECMARPIRNHHSPAVYDPFLGSGTTLIACAQLDRICYGLEIAPEYVAVTLERYRDLTGEAPERLA